MSENTTEMNTSSGYHPETKMYKNSSSRRDILRPQIFGLAIERRRDKGVYTTAVTASVSLLIDIKRSSRVLDKELILIR